MQEAATSIIKNIPGQGKVSPLYFKAISNTMTLHLAQNYCDSLCIVWTPNTRGID